MVDDQLTRPSGAQLSTKLHQVSPSRLSSTSGEVTHGYAYDKKMTIPVGGRGTHQVKFTLTTNPDWTDLRLRASDSAEVKPRRWLGCDVTET